MRILFPWLRAPLLKPCSTLEFYVFLTRNVVPLCCISNCELTEKIKMYYTITQHQSWRPNAPFFILSVPDIPILTLELIIKLSVRWIRCAGSKGERGCVELTEAGHGNTVMNIVWIYNMN